VTERRSGDLPDSGERRRAGDLEDRVEAFRLLRDEVLLGLGVVGVVGLTVAAVTIGVKDSALALAALTVFATLLGAPTFLRLDERRARDRNRDGE
jgi:hypothetical protein